jgi:hypothetical protein
VPMLARSEIADATSVGPSRAAIIFDVVMACPVAFKRAHYTTSRHVGVMRARRF